MMKSGWQNTMTKTTVTLQVTLENDKSVSAEVTVSWYTDHHYGADADGNRSISATFLDDIDFKVPTVDDDGDALTEAEQAQAEKLLTEAAEKVDLAEYVVEEATDYDWRDEMRDDDER